MSTGNWTIASTLATSLASLTAAGAVARDMWVRRQDQASQRSAQARLVTIRISDDARSVEFVNHSALPVYFLYIESAVAIDAQGSWWTTQPYLTTNANGSQGPAIATVYVEELAAQGTERCLLNLTNSALGRVTAMRGRPTNVEVTFRYTDADGLMWRRFSHDQQRLEEVKEQPVKVIGW